MSINYSPSQAHTIGTAAVTVKPFSFAVWARPTSAALTGSVVSIGDTAGDLDWFLLAFAGATGGDPVQYIARQSNGGSPTIDVLDTSTGYTAGQWTHACGVETSATARAVYINGGSKISSTTDVGTFTGLDSTSIGRLVRASPASYFTGDIADVAIWNAALSDAEVLILSKGYSPEFVRPQNLVGHWVMRTAGTIIDRVGGLNMTAVGAPTKVATEPRIIHPFQSTISLPAPSFGAVHSLAGMGGLAGEGGMAGRHGGMAG